MEGTGKTFARVALCSVSDCKGSRLPQIARSRYRGAITCGRADSRQFAIGIPIDPVSQQIKRSLLLTDLIPSRNNARRHNLHPDLRIRCKLKQEQLDIAHISQPEFANGFRERE